MSPEMQQLEARITRLERAENLDTNKLFLNYLIKNTPLVTDADVAKSISLTGNAQSISVLDYPDKWLEVVLDGKIYRVGAWLKENDSSR